jgi:outer membrane protein assembly factor BamB
MINTDFNFRFARAFLLMAWLTIHTASAMAEDASWSRFRGTDGNGISSATNLPVKWSETEVRWKAALPGKGHSSPVIWQDRIFVTSGNTNADRHVVCLGIADGWVRWQKQYTSETFTQNRENSYGSATPAVDGSGVYAYWTTPQAVTLAALTLDGKEKWVKNLGPFSGKHGSGASPVICNRLIWVNNDQDGPSAILALDADSGEIKYKIDRRADKVSYGTPCLFQQGGLPDQLIFASSSHGLTSVNPLTGAVNWDCTNLFKSRVVSSPITSEGLIICSSGEGGVGKRLVAVRPPAGTNAAEIVYEFKTGIPNIPTPLAKDGRLYIPCENGTLRCVRTATGESLWEERLPEKFYSSPVWARGRIYLTSKTGEVFVIAAADKYELLAQNPLGEPSFATPAIARETLFFRTESNLIAIGAQQ